MKKILFATDFSDACENAFEYLKTMIGEKKIEVDFVHVYDIPVAIATSIPPQAIKGMKDSKKEACIKRISSLRNTLMENQKGMIYPIYATYASSEIAELAEKIKSDLIVMGMKKEYGMFERIIGTTTAQTIQKSAAPVLAIPSGAPYQKIKTVLFPTSYDNISDLSDQEINSLVWLHEFLQITDSPQIHILHVSKEEDEVDVTRRHFPIAEIDFSITHARRIDKGIFKFLQEQPVELLAFYKPHRHFWSRLYHSSVSREVLYKSRLPMLIFSEPGS